MPEPAWDWVTGGKYARIMREWVTSIGLEPRAYGTQSMRRAKVVQIYKKTGNLRTVQLHLGQAMSASPRGAPVVMKNFSGRPFVSVEACNVVFNPPFVRPIRRPR